MSPKEPHLTDDELREWKTRVGGPHEDTADHRVKADLSKSLNPTTGSYFVRHWRGELSLPVSFWVNLVLVNSALAFLESHFEPSLFSDTGDVYPPTAARLALLVLLGALLLGLLLYCWQVIGVWRSARRHVEQGGKGWGRAAQVFVVLGVLGSMVDLGREWPLVRELYHVGVHDPSAVYVLKLEPNDPIIHLKGGLGFGISNEVSELLNQNPQVTGIILDSPGGRSYEGRALAKLIVANSLDTYSLEGCYSACTAAFIAGKKRHLATAANLAFHQLDMPEPFKSYGGSHEERERILELFRGQGVPQDFLDDLFTAGPDDAWYPTVDELLAANVVHVYIEPSDVLSAEHPGGPSLSGLEERLLEIAAFRTIKRHQPKTYDAILKELFVQREDGASLVEIEQSYAKYLVNVAERALPRTSDEAIVRFTEAIVGAMRPLRYKEPILCLKAIYPEKFGAVRYGKYLSAGQTDPILDALNQVILDSYERRGAPVDWASAERTIQEITVTMGNQASHLYLEPTGLRLRNREGYEQTCDATEEYLHLVVGKGEKIAGNVLRSDRSHGLARALCDAAGQGNLEELEALLAQGVNVNTQCRLRAPWLAPAARESGTPLHAAIYNARPGIVKVLLAHGADLNAKDQNGRTPLYAAVIRGDPESVSLLLARGTKVNETTDQSTRPLLHEASAKGNSDVVRLLLNHGAKVNVRDQYGRTPLHQAAFLGHPAVVKVLLARRADMTAKDKDGSTALHEATSQDHFRVVEALLTRGADVNVRRNDGKTPLDLATDPKIIKLLKQHASKK